MMSHITHKAVAYIIVFLFKPKKREIWCNIMFREYTWKTCSKIWSSLRIRQKQLYIIKMLSRLEIHSNVYKQNAKEAKCYTGKLFYRQNVIQVNVY